MRNWSWGVLALSDPDRIRTLLDDPRIASSSWAREELVREIRWRARHGMPPPESIEQVFGLAPVVKLEIPSYSRIVEVAAERGRREERERIEAEALATLEAARGGAKATTGRRREPRVREDRLAAALVNTPALRGAPLGELVKATGDSRSTVQRTLARLAERGDLAGALAKAHLEARRPLDRGRLTKKDRLRVREARGAARRS